VTPRLDKQPVTGGAVTTRLDKQPVTGGAVTTCLDKQPVTGGAVTTHLDKQPVTGGAVTTRLLAVTQHLCALPRVNTDSGCNRSVRSELKRLLSGVAQNNLLYCHPSGDIPFKSDKIDRLTLLVNWKWQ
jgi:hypothetical protein